MVERVTHGPSRFHLDVGVVPGERGAFIGSAYGVVRKGRVVKADFGSAFSGGRMDDPTVYSESYSFDSCDVGICDVGKTFELGQGNEYVDEDGIYDLTHMFVAAWGGQIAHRFEGTGWTLRTARYPFRFVDGQDAEAVGVAHTALYGAEMFKSASARGGRFGSIAVGTPPCSTTEIGLPRGVGEAVLTGGVQPETIRCPSFAHIATSWARKGTTWQFSGRVVGDTALVHTRLFVLDLPKRLRSPLG